MISIWEQFKYAKPSEASPRLEKIQGAGCRGEKVSLSFALSSTSFVESVELSCTQLRGSRATIDSKRTEIFLVRSRWKSGTGSTANGAVVVPEMLLRDDRVVLEDSYKRDFFDWHHLVRSVYRYQPPDVPSVGTAKTDLNGESKCVWLLIEIPEDIPPGLYEGLVKINSRTENVMVPIVIDVHPFELEFSDKDLCIWYRGTLDWQRSLQHYVSAERMQFELNDIRQCGFNGVSLNEHEPVLAKTAIAIARRTGFQRSLIFYPPFPPESAMAGDLTPLFYVADEPDLHTRIDGQMQTDSILEQMQRYCRQATACSAGAVLSLVSARSVAPLFAMDCVPKPVVISLLMPSNGPALTFLEQIAPGDDTKIWYYWICSVEAPVWNRVLSGYFLYASEADGICPYNYAHLPSQFHSPLNDFDPWEPDFTVRGEAQMFRDHMTVYPTKQGRISTIQWEALRDGIYDLRYITTLVNLCRMAESRCCPDSTEVVQDASALLHKIKQCLRPHAINPRHDSMTYPFSEIEPQTYDVWRQKIARLCSKLYLLLNPHASTE